MKRVLHLGRLSRTLCAFVAAFVLVIPPGLAGQLVQSARPDLAGPEEVGPKESASSSCCGKANAGHEACATKASCKTEVRASCCQHSTASGTSSKSCCRGLGGCGCSCCPSLLIAAVPVRPFEWSLPTLEDSCLLIISVSSGRWDTPPTPPPNVA